MNLAGLLTYHQRFARPSRWISGLYERHSELQLRDSTGLAPVSLLND
jgi:hypothetical protein